MAAWLVIFLVLLAFADGNVYSSKTAYEPGTGVRDVIPKQYIVFYGDDAGSVPAATLRLAQHVQSAASKSRSNLLVASAASSSIKPAALFTIRRTLDGSPTSQAAAALAAAGDTSISTEAAAAAAAGQRRSGRMLGVVVQVREGVDEKQLVQTMASAAHVQVVLPDLYVRAAQGPCADPLQLSRGITASSAATLGIKWAKCISPGNNDTLVWAGRRCSSNMQQIEYTALRVVDARGVTKTYEAAGKLRQCVRLLNPRLPQTNKQLFGGCGQAPTSAPDLPSVVCGSSAAAGSCMPQPVSVPGKPGKTITATITLAAPIKCTADEKAEAWGHTVTYTGRRCGPSKQLIRWTKATLPNGCVLVPGMMTDWVLRNDVFGDCGVPPGSAAAPLYSMQLCRSAAVPLSPGPSNNSISSPSPQPSSSSLQPLPDASPSPERTSPSPEPAASPAPQSPGPLPSTGPSQSPAPAAPSVGSSIAMPVTLTLLLTDAGNQQSWCDSSQGGENSTVADTLRQRLMQQVLVLPGVNAATLVVNGSCTSDQAYVLQLLLQNATCFQDAVLHSNWSGSSSADPATSNGINTTASSSAANFSVVAYSASIWLEASNTSATATTQQAFLDLLGGSSCNSTCSSAAALSSLCTSLAAVAPNMQVLAIAVNAGSVPVTSSPSPSPSPNPISEESPNPEPSASPSPSPQPCASIPNAPPTVPEAGSLMLPRKQLVANEMVPFGVQRIEGATCAGVADVSSQQQQQQQQLVVAVVDSGVDASHPDINYVGGISFVDSDAHSTQPFVDYFGHGTHVAGIMGAKNNGQGVVGVSPGIPIYSVKVLNSTGWGEAGTTLAAVNWLVTEGVKLGIQVINLSLAAYIGSTSPTYFQYLCSIYEKASAAGMIAVAAAGNRNMNALDFVPAGCPAVAVVTGLDYFGNSTSRSSSWVPSDVSAAVKARVINAPAERIISTVPSNVDPSGYMLLGGTSQAAPHVAAAAANCIMSGACKAGMTGMEKLAVVQAAAMERRNISLDYGFSGDPASPGANTSSKYYGYLVWAGKF